MTSGLPITALAWTGVDTLGAKFTTDTGETPGGTFGAYALQAIGATLFAGLGNEPGGSDGAEIVATADGATLSTERVLDEQGAADLDTHASALWVPGTDPTDDWSYGNLYRRTSGGVWSKIRNLPNVMHAWGACHDSAGRLYVATGAHDGGSVVEQGRVFRSDDDGATWAVNAQLNDYRVYDVAAHPSGRLYATAYNRAGLVFTEQLFWSADNGATWTNAGQTPYRYPRMTAFAGQLVMTRLVAGFHRGLLVVNADYSISTYDLDFHLPWVAFNPLAVAGAYLYALASDGFIWRTNDLATWSVYSQVAGGVSLAPFGSALIASGSGAAARLWSVAI